MQCPNTGGTIYKRASLKEVATINGLETQCCNDEKDNDGGETMAMTLMLTRLMSMPLTRGTARY